MVTREPWKACGFSSNGDYVVAGSATDTQHRVHLWDRASGTFLRTLDGGKTGILDLAWHPTRPVIVSLSTAGEIHVWAVNPNVRLYGGAAGRAGPAGLTRRAASAQENWSAFAPDFKELEENVEYIEREDEFDVVDAAAARRAAEAAYDDDVDVMTVERTYFGSR
jgi:COMPASS component SWD1